MRITGGIAKGIQLHVLKGNCVRPATDGLRQALFSSLGSLVEGARFVDLFAGSGSYGLEAFSRGAQKGIFVEKNAMAADCLRKNIALVCRSKGLPGTTALKICVRDVLRWEPFPSPWPADLIFIDPPYEIIDDIAPELFRRIRLLFKESNPLVAFETPGEISLSPEGWTLVKRLGKGGKRQPTLSLFSKS